MELLFLIYIICCAASGTAAQSAAYLGSCRVPSSAEPASGSIIDISHALRPDLPRWESEQGVGVVVELESSIANGSLANISILKVGVHTGTHVDAPSHIIQEYYETGDHVDTLDLNILNGLALLVDVPRDANLTAEAMEALKIPYGVERVIFKTLNTDRRLMWKKEFDTSYVGFTEEGALWLRENTKIKLIGIDYLSVAAFDFLVPAHVVFFQNKDIILVEGLNLDNVEAGLYELHCLPLLLKADGSPIRCILQK